jgi:HJR/Mrr/RecB family endonuclease
LAPNCWDYGIVITNNSFLKSAIKLAESSEIELWGGNELIDFISGDLDFSEIRSL